MKFLGLFLLFALGTEHSMAAGNITSDTQVVDNIIVIELAF